MAFAVFAEHVLSHSAAMCRRVIHPTLAVSSPHP